ncbi:hypothetical protein FPHYL_3969 [Fusarium phyllophilum]|uniref:Uncharacterized protein n=1 Tax=Fusarium phyllophilum TaxID=47803 RepID=A0A8H5K6Q9_9HYPO|nr:hypothetical protein FPHYL_3969 [Fusarium phyllophilum]
MDKSKGDSNDSPSSHTPENHRAKRLNTQGLPKAVASPSEQDEQRFIRRTGPYESYQPLITHKQWKDIIGSHVPPDRQTEAYHTSGWKAFVDLMARNIREGRSSTYDGHLELFIVCSRVYQCSPISIFSPFNGLSCDVPFSDQTVGDDTECPWWSTSARKLTRILTHSVFRGNLNHFLTVIQYAIILRTDDRRRWVIAKRSPNDSMLDALRSNIKYAEVENGMLKRPVRELQRAVDAADTVYEPSVVWDIMSSLAAIVEHPGTCTSRSLYHLDAPLYHATATDIENVQLAIDNSNWDAIPRFPSTDQCYKLFMQRPEKPEGGPDFDQLADFYCRAWHFEERKIAEYERN